MWTCRVLVQSRIWGSWSGQVFGVVVGFRSGLGLSRVRLGLTSDEYRGVIGQCCRSTLVPKPGSGTYMRSIIRGTITGINNRMIYPSARSSVPLNRKNTHNYTDIDTSKQEAMSLTDSSTLSSFPPLSLDLGSCARKPLSHQNHFRLLYLVLTILRNGL